ncbi:unnamed protein product [Enterobius vermicularis]|uniref:PHD-type domain-containing protein n=1 Tax=Enterobius vermicularis TaxID=51028 RepID=A0A0N4UUL2_ENTVE|nr:unnamed protein product [Enterobius vermicularis]
MMSVVKGLLEACCHFHLIADGACKKYPPDAKARFGRAFQSKLSVLLLSENQISGAQLQAMYDEVLNYYNEHNLNEMWLSDENDDNEVKPPVIKKMHTDVGLSRFKGTNDEKEKQKPALTTSSPTASATTTVPFSNLELSDDSEDDPGPKPLSSVQKNVKLCSVCGESSSGDGNANLLLDCDECKNSVHIKCNKSEVTMQQALDSRFVFVCSGCKDRESKIDRFSSNESVGLGKATAGKRVRYLKSPDFFVEGL